MLLFELKRCVFHTQIRQLSIFNICRENHAKTIGSCWLELKCLNSRNSNFTVSNLIHTNSEKNKEIRILPQLMWIPPTYFSFSLFSVLSSYLVLRFTIDNTFKFSEFATGAKQAISVISNALAKQNYEMLEGVMKERALKLLKHRVNLLTPEERNLLVIPDIKFFPIALKTLKRKDKSEAVVRIAVAGLYLNHAIDIKPNAENMKIFGGVVLNFVYVFERNYINGTGGSWIVRIANHEGL